MVIETVIIYIIIRIICKFDCHSNDISMRKKKKREIENDLTSIQSNISIISSSFSGSISNCCILSDNGIEIKLKIKSYFDGLIDNLYMLPHHDLRNMNCE